MKKSILGCVAGLLAASQAGAVQLNLSGANIIGASSVYNGDNHGFTGNANDERIYSQFGTANIFDSQLTDPVEAAQAGYWISTDGVYQPASGDPAFITIDLGAAYTLSAFTLFNTHNGSFNDRGTGQFSILASNETASAGNVGLTLGGTIATLVSGVLAAENVGQPLAAQNFTTADTNTYRYIQFVARTVATSGTRVSDVAFGLNELRVDGTAAAPPPTGSVPEPASWAMMVMGFGAAGAAVRRHRTRAIQPS